MKFSEAATSCVITLPERIRFLIDKTSQPNFVTHQTVARPPAGEHGQLWIPDPDSFHTHCPRLLSVGDSWPLNSWWDLAQ